MRIDVAIYLDDIIQSKKTKEEIMEFVKLRHPLYNQPENNEDEDTNLLDILDDIDIIECEYGREHDMGVVYLEEMAEKFMKLEPKDRVLVEYHFRKAKRMDFYNKFVGFAENAEEVREYIGHFDNFFFIVEEDVKYVK